MKPRQIRECLKESSLNRVTYKSTGYLLWMPKSKERLFDDAKQLSEEDLFWFTRKLIEYLEETVKEDKQRELENESQPVIPLERLQITNQLTKSKKKRLRFKNRLEKALENPENNSDLSVLVKNTSRALRKKNKLKKKASEALIDSCDTSNTKLERKLAAAHYFQYSDMILSQQVKYLHRRNLYEKAYKKLQSVIDHFHLFS